MGCTMCKVKHIVHSKVQPRERGEHRCAVQAPRVSALRSGRPFGSRGEAPKGRSVPSGNISATVSSQDPLFFGWMVFEA